MPFSTRFKDRSDAGRQLAEALQAAIVDTSRTVVLGLPRGGVPVAATVAELLQLPLDVLCVRKLGVPFHRELAMGAVAHGGAVVRNEEVLAMLRPGEAEFERVLEQERAELDRRERAYRGDAPPLVVRNRDIIVIDDGLATGATMEAAVLALRTLAPSSIVVAIPVAAAEAVDRLQALVDRIVCLQTPVFFGSVGQWYRAFDQTDDAEVVQLLAESRGGSFSSGRGDGA